jgi:hypothetical protein
MPPRDPDGGVILAWNPHTGNPWANVRRTLNAEVKRDRPAVIVLNEVKRHFGVLDGWAERNGYVCHQEKPLPEVAGRPVPEHGSTAVLIDAGLDILTAKPVAARARWKVFSHNRWHEPRRGWQIRYRDDSGRWKGWFMHGPTNGFEGGNRVAFAEFASLMAAALTIKAAGTTSFAVSDHNERLPALRRWARLFGAKVAGHGVDSCVVLGGTVTAETLGKHGSDHELIRYRVKR